MPRAKNKLSAVIASTEETVIQEITPELKEELNAVTTDETFVKLADNLRCSLIHAEEEIQRIDERAEIAIQVITQSIKTQAAVAKGKILSKIREQYAHLPSWDDSWQEFVKRLGVSNNTICHWIAAAKLVESKQDVLGVDFLMEQSATSLSTVQKLPEAVKEAVLEDAVENGKLPSNKELKEISKSTPVKVMKAQENLDAAIEKRQQLEDQFNNLKQDPYVSSSSPEYQNTATNLTHANNSIDRLNEQIAQLKTDLVGEKAKAESARKATEQLNKEIESLKWDDETAREQRIKRIQSTLTINIPQILSDLMKFTAEEKFYQDEYKTAIREQMVSLKTFLEEHV